MPPLSRLVKSVRLPMIIIFRIIYILNGLMLELLNVILLIGYESLIINNIVYSDKGYF